MNTEWKEPERRYHHRMVTRTSLGELEHAVRELESAGWRLVMQDGAPTIQEALVSLGQGAVGGMKMGLSSHVAVPMRIEFNGSEYAELMRNDDISKDDYIWLVHGTQPTQ